MVKASGPGSPFEGEKPSEALQQERISKCHKLSLRTEHFTPITPGKVRIDCCGLKDDDFCNLGQAIKYINWDVMRSNRDQYFIQLKASNFQPT